MMNLFPSPPITVKFLLKSFNWFQLDFEEKKEGGRARVKKEEASDKHVRTLYVNIGANCVGASSIVINKSALFM